MGAYRFAGRPAIFFHAVAEFWKTFRIVPGRRIKTFEPEIIMISKHSMSQLAKHLNVRISDEALMYLRELMEELAFRVAAEATELSEYAGRRTVMERDVEFIARKMFRDLI